MVVVFISFVKNMTFSGFVVDEA